VLCTGITQKPLIWQSGKQNQKNPPPPPPNPRQATTLPGVEVAKLELNPKTLDLILRPDKQNPTPPHPKWGFKLVPRPFNLLTI